MSALLAPLVGAGIVTAISGIIVAYIRTRPAVMAARHHGQEALWNRITLLEDQQKDERKECDDRLAKADMRIGKLEAELVEIRVENGAVMVITLDVTLALRKKDPNSPALKRAAATLRKAFPPEVSKNPALHELLDQLDAKYGDEA